MWICLYCSFVGVLLTCTMPRHPRIEAQLITSIEKHYNSYTNCIRILIMASSESMLSTLEQMKTALASEIISISLHSSSDRRYAFSESFSFRTQADGLGAGNKTFLPLKLSSNHSMLVFQ